LFLVEGRNENGGFGIVPRHHVHPEAGVDERYRKVYSYLDCGMSIAVNSSAPQDLRSSSLAQVRIMSFRLKQPGSSSRLA
jgi:hypothetical protein